MRALVASLLLLGGCASMTPTQKRVAAVAITVVVVGAIAAQQQGDGRAGLQPQPNCNGSPQLCR